MGRWVGCFDQKMLLNIFLHPDFWLQKNFHVENILDGYDKILNIPQNNFGCYNQLKISKIHKIDIYINLSITIH